MLEAVYWRVTTATIKTDWTYNLTVVSNYTDKEFRNCIFLQQPNINTFPKIGDIVLVLIIARWEYIVLWIVPTDMKKYLAIGKNEEIKIWETEWKMELNTSTEIKINSAGVILTWTTITANWEDLTTDNV